MQWRKSGITVIVRTAIGLPLAAVASGLGMAVASAMAVFFGVADLSNILLMLMIGAGIGAGIGAAATLFRVDSVPSWPVVLAILIAFSLASGLGGWAGFQVGEKISAIEDANCIGVCGYLFKPRTYIALGATLVANAIALAVNISYEGRGGFWPRPRFPLAGPTADRSGNIEGR